MITMRTSTLVHDVISYSKYLMLGEELSMNLLYNSLFQRNSFKSGFTQTIVRRNGYHSTRTPQFEAW